jgi:hypothetical protein
VRYRGRSENWSQVEDEGMGTLGGHCWEVLGQGTVQGLWCTAKAEGESCCWKLRHRKGCDVTALGKFREVWSYRDFRPLKKFSSSQAVNDLGKCELKGWNEQFVL